MRGRIGTFGSSTSDCRIVSVIVAASTSDGGAPASNVCVCDTSTFIGKLLMPSSDERAASKRRTWYVRRCAAERPESAGVSLEKNSVTSSTYDALSLPNAWIGNAASTAPTLFARTEIAIASESSA